MQGMHRAVAWTRGQLAGCTCRVLAPWDGADTAAAACAPLPVMPSRSGTFSEYMRPLPAGRQAGRQAGGQGRQAGHVRQGA